MIFVFALLFSCGFCAVSYGDDSGGSGLLRNGTAGGFADGDGTSANPWIIETPEQLDLVRNYLGTGNNDKYFKLGCDIDLADYLAPGGAGYNAGAGWIPIGYEVDNTASLPGANDFRFTGTFDGDNHVIKNLVIDTVQSGAGLFGAVGTGGVVKNLGLVDGEVKGGDSVGGLVGYMNGGTIENCFTSIRVIGSAAQIGGLVGYAHSYRGANTIENCFSLGDVIGDAGVGGLVGYSWSGQGSTIKDCYATGDVIGNFYVGGLVGEQYSASGDNNIIENCYATGDVTGIPGSLSSRSESIGGLVGRQNSMSSSIARINNCYATGSVSGGDQVGGLVGLQIRSTNMLSNTGRNNIANSYAMGDVVGHNFVGGLVGQQRIGDFNPINGFAMAGDGHNYILNCYATGSVTGNDFVGGLAGSQYKTSNSAAARSNNINNCYATGVVTSVLGDHVGGLVGEQFGSACNLIDCFFDADATGVAVGVGNGVQTGVIGLSTEQMTDDDTLESGGAMSSFDGSVWSKRVASSLYCYYPELTVFYGDGLLDTVWKTASELSVRVLMDNGPLSVFTIVYDGNGHTGGAVPEDTDGDAIAGSNSYYDGSQVIVLGPGDLVRVNYSFKGWAVSQTAADAGTVTYLYDSDMGVFSPADFTITDDVVLYAVWTENNIYTIVYDGNGHTGGAVPEDTDGDAIAGSNSYYVNSQVIVLGPGDLVRVNYSFKGWATSQTAADAGTVTYAYNSGAGSFSPANFIITDNIVLYAVWTENVSPDIYAVVYYGNGNSGGSAPVDSNWYFYGDRVTVLGQGSLIRVGYSFLGWSTSSTANNAAFTAGSIFTIYDDIVLYAIWTQNVYTVTYDPGTHGTFTTQVTGGLRYGDKTPAAPTVTGTTGWNFTGWLPAPSVTVTSNATYVAQWTQTPTPPTPSPSPTPTASPSPSPSPTPTASAPPTSSPAPTVSPTVTPPTSTVPPTSTPVPPVDGDKEPVWALVNLVLSVVGFVLVILLMVCILLQQRKQRVNKEKDDKQQNIKNQNMVTQGGQQEEDDVRQIQRRNVWLITAIIMGIAGIIVFLLTEDMSLPRNLVDKWSIVNITIFAIELIAIFFTFKYQKTKNSNKP